MSQAPGKPKVPDKPIRPGPSSPGGRAKALALALVMHLLLVAMLVIGVSWKTSEPPPVVAELWTPPAPDEVKPEPRPEPEPRPVPPPPPPPPPKPAPKPQIDPQIAIEKARKEAEARQRALLEEQKKRKAAELERQRKLDEERRHKAELERQRKLEEEKQRKAEEEKQRKLEEEKQRKLAAEKKRKAEQERKRRADEERQRAAYVERLQQQAGTTGGAASGASGARATAGGRGVDSGYQARVGAAIRANTNFLLPEDLQGNPKAEFLVQLLPDCSVVSVKLRKSSGLPAWDTAAERGIQRTNPFPRMNDGTCPSEFLIIRGPRDG